MNSNAEKILLFKGQQNRGGVVLYWRPLAILAATTAAKFPSIQLLTENKSPAQRK